MKWFQDDQTQFVQWSDLSLRLRLQTHGHMCRDLRSCVWELCVVVQVETD